MHRRTMVTGLGLVVILAVLAAVLIPRPLKPEQPATDIYWPTHGWRSSTPEEQGIDSGKLAEGLQAMRGRGLDSLLIIRNGYVVLDAYFYPYADTIPHKLASVTKTVMTTLVGIAVDQSKLQLDQPLVSFFPNRAIANLDARKERITIQDLVAMRNGFESGCLAGDEATLNTMRANPDWVQAALDRTMAREPGTSFCYDSPGMHLLSAILQEATGMTALDFAQQNLFEPLGIREVVWQSDPQGCTRGWGDLFLKPRDAARIGYLWLSNGVWEGKRIVSATWVTDSVTAYSNAGGDGYGYGWWVSDDNYYAQGRGGQNIKVYPSYSAIVITTGSGFEYDQVAPWLTAAFVDPSKPLPANPVGMARLEEMLAVLAQAPDPWPVGTPPDSAQAIAGRTYLFEPNPIDLGTLRLEFDPTSAVTLYTLIEGRDAVWPISLDGTYRLSSAGQGVRGYWADPQTLVIEVFEDGLRTLWLQFEADRVEVTSDGLKVEGRTEDR